MAHQVKRYAAKPEFSPQIPQVESDNQFLKAVLKPLYIYVIADVLKHTHLQINVIIKPLSKEMKL